MTRIINSRIELINKVLNGTGLNNFVNLDITETENFDNKKKYNDIGEIVNKEKKDFVEVLKQLGGKIRYIKSGATGHIFNAAIPYEQDGKKLYYNVGIKVTAYYKKNYGSINNPDRPENAELKMLKVLSQFVVKKQTPHLALPIASFNTKIKHFLDDALFLTKEEREKKELEKRRREMNKRNGIKEKKENKKSKYEEFIEEYEEGNLHNEVSVLISEWADCKDFLNFLRNNYAELTLKEWKVFLFQIISTLSIIQMRYPGFRHNDLKANNILIQSMSYNTEEDKKKTFKYKVSKCSYVVPNIGYHIKIWDFDFACIPGTVDNEKCKKKWANLINVTPEQNRYYDIHFFFNTLVRNEGFLPEILIDSKVPIELKEFINRIVPVKYREEETNYFTNSKGEREALPHKIVHERGRILINKEYTFPDKILKEDPFFEEFRVKRNIENRYALILSDLENTDLEELLEN
jgi:serine/threonine protein kinase